jgi:reverse gyrase
MKMFYLGLCPNCGGTISSERLGSVALCKNCLEKEIRGIEKIYRKLLQEGKLKNFKEIYEFEKAFDEFSNLFKKLVGQKPWSLQEVWVRRILGGNSFAIIAPTGVGKTVCGIITAIFFARKGKKSYLILPTSLLVEQVAEKLLSFVERLGKELRIAYYHSGLKSRDKKQMSEKITKGEFEIIVTTERFLLNNFEKLKNFKFDFIFVDDVDSFLKSPKNIDKVLVLLGFSQAIVNNAIELLRLRTEINKLAKMRKKDKTLEEKVKVLREKITSYKKANKIGILVVSGATTKAKRTKRIKLFRELLDFELGYKPEYLRNMKDFYKFAENLKEETLKIVGEFGDGCLIFVPMDLGRVFAEELAGFLNAHGIKAFVYEKMEEHILERFVKGEYDCLVGIASYRSPLARGIDLPERIRYVIFAGVPKFKIKLSYDEYNPSKLLTLLKNLREFLGEEAEKHIDALRKIVPMKAELIEEIKDAIEEGKRLEGFEEFARNIIEKVRNFLKKVITPKLISQIESSKELMIEFKDNEFFLIISDPIAYLQASGRASRLFAGGISRGASILLIDNEKSFNDLKKKTKIFAEDIEWKEFDVKKMKKWFERIDEDRKLMKEIKAGKIPGRIRNYIKTALMIVESPTKARTIARFFGRPYRREIDGVTIYETSIGEYILNIVATMGHSFDLIYTQGFHGILVNEQFVPVYDFIKKCKECGEQLTEYDKCPKCGSENLATKEKIIKVLRKVAREVNVVFLASDPDAEGEKIAWDVFCALKPFNKNIFRLEFHEITKRAILNAIKKKRKIDEHLVEAQIVRRIEDRWIGFELSEKLWKEFHNRRLSAGRVQSPVLGWIIERTKQSREKKPIALIKLENDLWLSLEEFKFDFPLKEFAKKIREKKVLIDVSEFEKEISPLPPYTTDSLLKDASLKLKLNVEQTMRIAQDLFELGLITYHRTDSTSVSSVGISLAKEYIEENFPGNFKGRGWRKEGAHECIRPTHPIDVETLRRLITMKLLRFPRKLTSQHLALYDLIFKRFIASQMKEAKVRSQKIIARINGNEVSMERTVALIEEGFAKLVYLKIEKPIEKREYAVVGGGIKWVPKAFPFSQGEIVAQMKEKGIGRPSTYAKIVETLFLRKYVVEKNGKIFPTRLGFKVYSFLTSKYREFVSEELTRKLEEEMDRIERGEVDYQEVLRKVYEEVRRIAEN